jgi:glutamine amidotransferase
MNEVVVIDYGAGNLYSVKRALEYCGADVILTDDAEIILNSQRIILPGVGAFKDGMNGLLNRGLVPVLQEYARSGNVMMGICLGMQMLVTTSEEFGHHAGLNIIPGHVERIPNKGVNGMPHKIPHIGWTELIKTEQKKDWNNTIISQQKLRDSVYIVHSYAVTPDDPDHRLADCLYNGLKISAVINKGNIYGCQFHPEKSGKVGLEILRKFLTL